MNKYNSIKTREIYSTKKILENIINETIIKVELVQARL